jgi:undecaprenyl pyrophosphate phosphatase UppP
MFVQFWDQFWFYSAPGFFLGLNVWFGHAAVISGLDRIKGTQTKRLWLALLIYWLVFTLVCFIFRLPMEAIFWLWFVTGFAIVGGILFWLYAVATAKANK